MSINSLLLQCLRLKDGPLAVHRIHDERVRQTAADREGGQTGCKEGGRQGSAQPHEATDPQQEDSARHAHCQWA